VWLLLFGLGAALLYRLPLPAALAALPYPPPLEARYALYFLVAALLRVAILRARVGALERRERRAKRVPRREARFALAPPGLIEVGAGIGKGVAEAMLGNPFSAAWAGAALLLRFAASRPPEDPTLVARRAAERKRKIVLEQRRGALCIFGVGLVCVAACWWPVLASRWPATWALVVHTAQAQTRGWR
jgi:hypothetical protein